MPLRDELVGEVRRFASRALDDGAIEREGIEEPILAGAREFGLFGLTIPERWGGLGLVLGDACAVVAELARWDRSVATMIGLHAGLGTHAIVQHGSEELQSHWLPRLASGEAIAAFAATEASAGSDIAGVRTRASIEGEELVVRGEKSYVTNARLAACFTTLVRWGERSHALILVPRDAIGVVVGPEEDKLGIRASSTAPLVFDDVRLSKSHLLGEPGGGLALAHATLMRGRVLMAAGCVGTARTALHRTKDHVAMRRQFRRPIGHFPAVRHRVMELASIVCAMEALVFETAAQPDEASSIATKVFASEGAFEVCDAAVQLHGALGVMEPVGVCRLLRDCRVTRIFEGANDVLLVRLALARLATTPRTSTPASRLPHAVETLSKRIECAFDNARARLGATAVQRQAWLQSLARADVALRAASACARLAGVDNDEVTAFAIDHWTHAGHLQLDELAYRDEAEARAQGVGDRSATTRASAE